MTDPPKDYLTSNASGGDGPNTTGRPRKRDSFFRFIGVKPKPSKQSMSPQLLSQQATALPSDSFHSKDNSSPPPLIEDLLRPDIFPENLPKPVIKTILPRLHARIEETAQLVYCNTSLLQDDALSAAVPREGAGEEALFDLSNNTPQKDTLDNAQLAWLAEVKRDPTEQGRLRWLVDRMVDQFVGDPNKDSIEIAEMVALGPVLSKESYRKLLSSIIKDFGDTLLLNINLLQGLVQLVQSASKDFLVSDDLIKIFSLLRVRLQGTHQQSTEYPYHLTQAVAMVLDVMADHKVEGLYRVQEHEPLCGVLIGLKDSSDFYLMYQACYAFQALQYVPDDETALQAMIRHSTGVIDGLVKVTGVFKLDIESVLEGLGKLQEAVSKTIETVGSAYDGVCSLMESGRGIMESLKDGLGSGQKRPWYPAVKAGYAFAQSGQLNNLKQLIYCAPCRRDPLFQWGISQLLGEIAMDLVWDVDTRQQSVVLLCHLYNVDPDWCHDAGVKAMIVTILEELGASDESTTLSARTLLQELKQVQEDLIFYPYPLKSHLPIPASSPVLAKVQSIPYVEYDLHRLRAQLLEEVQLRVYIPPMAKASLQAADNDISPLMDKVQEFLRSERQVMLIMGDSGAGKSTFNKHLELELLRSYKNGDRIPLFINLPAIRDPGQDMISKQLQIYNFKDDQIQELKMYRQFVVICDGYDESQLTTNIHDTNLFNRSGQWSVKLVISCRTQYLGRDYRYRFVPQGGTSYNQPRLDLFLEAVIAPFSLAQIKDYVEQYVPLEPRTWRTEDYMSRLTTIPNLMDLVRIPFLLSLALEALPGVTEGKQDLSTIKITRVQLYDSFVTHWLNVNKRRLMTSNLSDLDRKTLDQLLDGGFVEMGINYSTRLALAIFEKQGGNPVVQYVHIKDKVSWRAEFFGPEPEIWLLRESAPLTRTGNHYRFIHRSMLEYFFSRAVYNPPILENHGESSQQSDSECDVTQVLDPNCPMFKQSILTEPSVIQFLCERVQQDPNFEKQLLAVIHESKTDVNMATASANAITILVRAGVRFHSADLRGIKVRGADLSCGQFDSVQFQGADLREVNFTMAWLRQADCSGAQMEDVRFGELPYLDEKEAVRSCTYSRNGKMLAVLVFKARNQNYHPGRIRIYDTATWTNMRDIQIDDGSFQCISFSPDSQHLISGHGKGEIRLWDVANGESLWVMKGDTQRVTSVAFSPNGRQVCSASQDGTARSWDVETRECILVLNCDNVQLYRAEYSSDGLWIVSGSHNAKIRCWNAVNGEPGPVWNYVSLASSAGFHSLALSPDGLHVTFSTGKDLNVWNMSSGKLTSVLRGHTNYITAVAFSPNGQWIVSSSWDREVRLWDVSAGTTVSVLSGHEGHICDVSFSPDDRQIASGDVHGEVRLWEVNTTGVTADPSGHSSAVQSVAYTSDGRSIVSGHILGAVLQWDRRTGAPGSTLFNVLNQPHIVVLSSDCSLIVSLDIRRDIQLWNRHTEVTERTFAKTKGATKVGILMADSPMSYFRLTFSTCGRWIVFRRVNSEVQLHDLHRVDEQGDVCYDHMDVDGFSGVSFSPCELHLAFGLKDSSVCLYDLQSKSCLKKIQWVGGDSEEFCALAYSPNGQQLAVGSSSGSVRILDLVSETFGAELKEHNKMVNCVAYSPCANWIISGSDDKTTVLWGSRSNETKDWDCVAVVRGFSDSIDCVAWNPVDSTEFTTGCQSGSVRVWRISSEGGEMSVHFVWSHSASKLLVSDLKFKGTTGLSSSQRRLLVQRGAIVDADQLKEEDQ